MLGIVILNYKSFYDTVKCTDSIVETIKKTKYKVYIIDNDSPDDSFPKLSNYYKNVDIINIIASGKNGGYSHGNNVGIKLALEDECDAIMISNTDIIYYPEAIDSMYSKLISKDDVAVVGPDMVDSEGKYSQINILAPTLRRYWMNKKPLSYLNTDKQNISKYENDYKFLGMVQGSSFLIKTQILKKIGLLDENVFLFGEEAILAHKLNEIKYYTLIDSEALIKHEHSKTITKEGIAFERMHMYYSLAYVLKQYSGISNVELYLVNLYNLINYKFKSLYDKSYRNNYNSLKNKLNELYTL